MTTTQAPIAGASYDNRPEWLAQRRGGVTATEVATAATGRSTDRRKIIIEKVTGADTPDLSGNQYIAWGNQREPYIAAWVQQHYGIAPSNLVLAAADNPRFLATPDGYEVNPFGEILIAEFKTSKHDLHPGVGALTVKRLPEAVHTKGHFWSTHYYDQMQWQMRVTGATQCLFVYEQHDNQWPNPTPQPVVAVWVERNDKRIAQLEQVAEQLLAEVDAAKADTLPMGAGDLPPEVADQVHLVLEARNAEAVAKAKKEQAWQRVKGYASEAAPAGHSWETPEAKVSWSITTSSRLEYDLTQATEAQAAAIEKARRSEQTARERVEKAEQALAKAQDAQRVAAARVAKAKARFATEVPEVKGGTLTITAARTSTKEN